MKRISIFLFLLPAIFSQGKGQAQPSGKLLNQKHFWLADNMVAYAGYDATSYFTSKPVKGKASFSAVHEGITYWFSNENNKKTFLANPDKYVPAYGGWCAYAIGAKAEKVEPDPLNFKLVNGRVNLFYRNFFSNTLNDWNEDEKNLKTKADQNWRQTIYK